MPGDLYMSAVTARCTAPTSSYSVVWLPPNKVYQITLYCGSTSLVSFLVGAFRGKAWSYMKKKNIIKMACGLAIGFINGLLGAGGGMLAVPLLKKYGLDTKEAHASSIAVILPLTIFSAALYVISGRVNISDSFIYIPTGILGAVIGAFILKKIPDKWIRRLFGIFMIWAGIRLFLR